MSDIISMYAFNNKKEVQKRLIPKGAEILSVCVRQETIMIAVKQDVNAYTNFQVKNMQTVEIAIIGEHRNFNVDGYNFLGTVVLNFGNDIYHVLYRYIQE